MFAKMIKALMMPAFLTATVTAASSASLGLLSSGPTLTASNVTLGYLDLGGGEAGLSGFADVSSSTGISPDGPTTAFVDVSFLASAPNEPVFGTLDVSDDSGAILLGDFVDLGVSGSTLELLFDVFGGRFDADFGAQILVQFTLETGHGAFLLSGLSDGDILTGSATISGNLTPIPLPASASLFAVAMLGFALLRKKQSVKVPTRFPLSA